MEEQIDSVKNEIMEQIDAHMEHLEVMEDTEGEVLQMCKQAVHDVVGKMPVAAALQYCAYLQDTGELPRGKDRITCFTEYLYACMHLQLATRYA
jgi:hypothetical protein